MHKHPTLAKVHEPTLTLLREMCSKAREFSKTNSRMFNVETKRCIQSLSGHFHSIVQKYNNKYDNYIIISRTLQ